MATPDDPFDLQRFATAQEAVFDEACAELRRGEKRSHWMWFVFPQLRGLGRSATAETYGLASAEEARAYLRHPILGPRLRTCTQLVNEVQGRSLEQIFGWPDHLKFRSCMTLFAIVAPEESVFSQALCRYGDGEMDPKTVALLEEPPARER